MLNRNLELTRRIDDEDAVLVEAELRKIEHPEAAIAQLIKDLADGKWQDSSITDPMMPYVALLAYQNSSLSIEDFSTLLFFWSASHLYQLKAITPDQPEFKKTITDTLKKQQVSNDENFRKQAFNALSLKALFGSQMSAAELEKLFIEIEKLPKSQQVIFTYDETIDLIDLAKSNVITDRLNALNFSPLNRPQFISQSLHHIATMQHSSFCEPPKPTIKSMIPSLSIMQAYLNVKFGDQAVKIKPVLGFSSLEDIYQNGLTALRDMALHFPFIKLPKIADGFLAEWFHFTWHDFYHAFAASAIPEHHRKLFTKMSDVVKALAEQNNNPHEKEALNSIVNSLIDLEHSNYRSLYSVLSMGDGQENTDAIFLITLTTLLNKFIQPSNHTQPSSGISKPTRLCKETTENLFNAISKFIRENDKEISAELSENHHEIIVRNFGKTRLATEDDKRYTDRIFSITAYLKHAWQKTENFTLFSSPKNQPATEVRQTINAFV